MNIQDWVFWGGGGGGEVGVPKSLVMFSGMPNTQALKLAGGLEPAPGGPPPTPPRVRRGGGPRVPFPGTRLTGNLLAGSGAAFGLGFFFRQKAGSYNPTG